MGRTRKNQRLQMLFFFNSQKYFLVFFSWYFQIKFQIYIYTHPIGVKVSVRLYLSSFKSVNWTSDVG